MKQNDKLKWTQTRITHIFETQQLTNQVRPLVRVLVEDDLKKYEDGDQHNIRRE